MATIRTNWLVMEARLPAAEGEPSSLTAAVSPASNFFHQVLQSAFPAARGGPPDAFVAVVDMLDHEFAVVRSPDQSTSGTRGQP